MREELKDNELEMVAGGTVVVSNIGNIGFTSLGVKYRLQNVDWKTARNVAEDMYDQNIGMSDAEFDQLVLNTFMANGWI